MKRLLTTAATITAATLAMTPLATGTGSAAPRSTSPGVAASALPRPLFQMPFPCRQKWRIDTGNRTHNPAIDMVREPRRLTEGSSVVASASGVVVRSAFERGGNVIQINHGGRWFTTYAQLRVRSVRPGQRVAQGQQIGQAGRPRMGAFERTGLHFELAYDRNSDGKVEWGRPNNERRPVVFNGRTYTGAGRTWRNVVSRNRCSQTTNPYTPARLCGPGYRTAGSKALIGGRVYILRNGRTLCVVTLKTTNLGTPTSMSASLQMMGQQPKIDKGLRPYYAGPVKAIVNRLCHKWGGSIGRSSYISPWTCG